MSFDWRPISGVVTLRKTLTSSKFNKITIVGLLILFLLIFYKLYIPRINTMGLYSDDWIIFLESNPFNLVYFKELSYMSLNRPEIIPLYWIIGLVDDWSPARVQGFAIALSLAGALSVGLIAHTVMTVLEGSKIARRAAFGLATTLFLVFPWNLGLTGWISESVHLSSIIWFAFALRFLLLPGKRTVLSLFVGGVLLLISFLAYEIFYGQASLFVAFAWFVTRERRARRFLCWSMAVTVLANAIAVTFNRLIASEARKTFDPEMWHIFAQGYGQFLDVISKSFVGQYAAVIALAALALVLSLIALAFVHAARRTTAYAIFTLTGIVLGGLLFSMAGYGITALGYMSRTLFAFSFHAAVFLGVGLGVAITSRSGFLRTGGCAVAIGLIFVFGLATGDRVRDWQTAWADQLAILRSLPAVPNDILESRSMGAYFGPGTTNHPIWLASNNWEISGALSYAAYLQSPTAARRHQVMDWRLRKTSPWPWMAGGPDMSLEWTGDRLIERQCGSGTKIDSRPTNSVYIWQAGDPALVRAKGPFHAGCDKTKRQTIHWE